MDDPVVTLPVNATLRFLRRALTHIIAYGLGVVSGAYALAWFADNINIIGAF